MPSYNEVHFRRIEESTGGTFTFSYGQSNSSNISSRDINHIEYIGTTGCYTCVGIYFKITATKCCCLHVNCTSGVNDPKNIVSEDDGKFAAHLFRQRLGKEAEDHNWNVASMEFGKDIVVICPHRDITLLYNTVYKRTGWYIVQGLREWFDSQSQQLAAHANRLLEGGPNSARDHITANEQKHHVNAYSKSKIVEDFQIRANALYHIAKGLTADRKSHGFAVHHRTGEVKLFKVPEGPLSEWGDSEDLLPFIAVDEPGLDKKRSLWDVRNRKKGETSIQLGKEVKQKLVSQLENNNSSCRVCEKVKQKVEAQLENEDSSSHVYMDFL